MLLQPEVKINEQSRQSRIPLPHRLQLQPVGLCSAFQVALNSKIYIDKTGLIACMNDVLDSTDGYICNSRPRRFGKSYAANMLAAYYSKGADSEEMFFDLEIGKTEDFKKHLNKYDVIHIDVQWFLTNCEEAENVVAYITRIVLDELREIYPEILSEDVRSLPDGLSRVKDKTGQKFIIIIDEWDVLIRDESANKKVQDEYIRFLRSMFKGTEPTKYIQLAYLTGILPIKKERTQSALNNFREYSMLNAGPLASYIGFTEEEVVNLMTDGNFQSYWSGTASYDSIVPLVNMDFDGLKTAIIEMLSGTAVEVDVASFQNDIANIVNKDDVLTYLIHMGYLGYSGASRMAFVPNEEIRQELIRATRRKRWNEMLLFQQESELLLDATLDMDGEAVAERIEKIHEEYASTIQYNNENSLSSVLALAYLSAMQYYFKPVRELPTGRGFADFVFIPKPEYKSDYPALVVELKWNKSAVSALQQIKDRKYPDSIQDYTGDILLVGINYSKKDKKHECVIKAYKKK